MAVADEGRRMEHADPGWMPVTGRIDRRALLRRAAALGMGAPTAAAMVAALGREAVPALAQQVTCPPAATPQLTGTPMPASGMTIGVTVAYLSVPFYANFKTGLADGARQFGFE